MADHRLDSEADYFSAQNNQRQRQVAWTALPGMQQRIREHLDIDRIASQLLITHRDKRGLTLACGDMTGPYGCFRQCGIRHIDAWDISEGQRDKFFATRYDGSVDVDYRIGDVNTLILPDNSYDLIIVQQAYHHFEALEHVTEQICRALKPHGLLLLKDYIGPNFLQRSPRQLSVCTELWQQLPPRWRTNAAGKICDHVHVPARDQLPPFEAVRAEDIMPVLKQQMKALYEHQYAGIMFPLFNGFAHNYRDCEEDLAFIERIWQLDEQLVSRGEIEANFVRGIFVRQDYAAC